MIWIDFESRSECDLPRHGVYSYARDPSTKVLCMAWAIDDGEVEIWAPDQEFPKVVADAVAKGDTIMAHNAAFERLIWSYVLGPDHGVPVPKLEQFYCTAAQARANCAPGSLEDVGRFAGAAMKKDHKGAALVRKCCCPPFKHTEQDLADLFAYCAQDVRAMRAVSQAMRPLSAQELADYHTNERVNDRGVLVDVALAKAAQTYALQELEAIEGEVQDLTEGEITSVRSPKMRQWVWDRVGPQARKLMTKDEKPSIDKSVRAALLILAEENKDEVPAHVADVIQCADDLWASSVAKFKRMADLADVEDHRVRGAFVFAGGAATGRYSSYGAQLHNMSRVCAEAPDEVRHAMVRGHAIVPKYGKRVTDVLKGMLRPVIMASSGRKLVAFDWSAIEARVTPWCSADPIAERTLDVFRSGKDIYVSTAAAMFNKPEADVTKSDRMLGKVAVLACGFAGSVGAFASMGRIYGVRLTEIEARRMVDLWRRTNPWAPRFWRALENAMLRAMRNPGEPCVAGKVTYLRHGDMLWYQLPSGRVLCYPYARFEQDGSVSFAKAAWKPSADAKEWPRARLWVGTLVENLVQATANCVLRHAMREMDKRGIQVIGSVHDEIIAECDEQDADAVQAAMREIMCAPPDWAKGLPLAVEGSIMLRYSK